MYHRVDDIGLLPASRFWSLVERLHYYGGAVAHAATRADESGPQDSQPEPAGIEPLSSHQVQGLLRQPLYGDIPGLGPAFSVSYAPLAPSSEEVSDG